MNTLSRAFGDSSLHYDRLTTRRIAAEGSHFGSAGGVKDLILSMLTFGIYGFVKAAEMQKKHDAISRLVVNLYRQAESNLNETTIFTRVDGEELVVSDDSVRDQPQITIRFQGKVITIVGMDLSAFRRHLHDEVHENRSNQIYLEFQDSRKIESDSPLGLMPPLVKDHIFEHLSSEDMFALIRVNQEFATFGARERATAGRLKQQAEIASTSDDFTNVLHDVQKLPPGYQRTPLTILIDRIANLPPDQRVANFNRLLAAIKRLNTDDKARLLTTLARYIRCLPGEEERKEATESTLNTTEQLAGDPLNAADTSRLLTVLADQLVRLPSIEWTQTFDRILKNVKQLDKAHQGQPLAALAEKIPFLPVSTRNDNFTRILADIEQLDVGGRTRLLKALSPQIRALPGCKLEFFDRLLTAVEPLNATDQAEPLTSLALVVSELPPEKSWVSYKRILHAIEQLNERDQGDPLMALAGVVYKVAKVKPRKQKDGTVIPFLEIVRLLGDFDRRRIGKALARNLPTYWHPFEKTRARIQIERFLEVSL
ncbi:hypothetical protein IAG25_40450 [Caballeronia sp. EK]|uniref:hypothetical protein n=1 Tax=Caballeronia sp. EK TaxID=2767469 RepID=UPI0016550FC0|nr:hypothetical protein [Caballeronia sp. EK]MBC8643010.1 hypothetical protein [Caballeronia sp. EK]